MSAIEVVNLILGLVKDLADVIAELTRGSISPEEAIARARLLHQQIPDDEARLDQEAAELEKT